ncbi:hypothetical protein Tco_0569534 [Tanacetum coccineum]
MSVKVEEPKLEDIAIVQNFSEVFPNDLSGLPPPREVEFRIDLILGAMPVVKSPYCLAPTKMEELSNQLKELDEVVQKITTYLCKGGVTSLASVGRSGVTRCGTCSSYFPNVTSLTQHISLVQNEVKSDDEFVVPEFTKSESEAEAVVRDVFYDLLVNIKAITKEIDVEVFRNRWLHDVPPPYHNQLFEITGWREREP